MDVALVGSADDPDDQLESVGAIPLAPTRSNDPSKPDPCGPAFVLPRRRVAGVALLVDGSRACSRNRWYGGPCAPASVLMDAMVSVNLRAKRAS